MSNRELISFSDLQNWTGLTRSSEITKRLDEMGVHYWTKGKNNTPYTLLSNLEKASESNRKRKIEF